ncbi:MAG: AraC family transcriptional regulator [Chloroflexota bacterium]
MNKTTIWVNPDFPEIEFFTANYTNFSYAPHFHEDYAIGVVEQGVHAFQYRGETFAIPAGRVVTCQPGEIHNGYSGSEEPWRYRMLYLHPSLLQDVAAELGFRSSSLPFLSYTSINHKHAIYAVRSLHQQSTMSETTLAQEVRAREMLALILSNFSEVRPNLRSIHDERTPIERTIAMMHDRYAEDIQLHDLATAAHLSKSYFIRAFRHHTSMSPYAYLVQVRLNRAKSLLRHGTSPVKVAQRTGFYDQSHLTRSFKRFMGISPGQYAAARG